MTQEQSLNILKSGANVFLTGEPGSGKTYTINRYIAWLRERGVEPAITASTGIAATHVGGMTIHAWSGIGIKRSLSDWDLEALLEREPLVRRVRLAHVLIIDEVSMLDAHTLAMVDSAVRTLRGNERPFGGLQVIFVGDFFQLPPVSKGEQSKFAFESPAWDEANPLHCYLNEQHRQEDGVFLELLGALRAGKLKTDRAADGVEALEKMRADKPDLVLLDLLMPRKSGEEVLEAMKNDDDLKDIPVLITTVKDDQETISRCAVLGVRGYFVKAHYTLDEIIAKVKEVLAENRKV